MVIVSQPNVEGLMVVTRELFCLTGLLLLQTAILAIGWSDYHSEIVCEKGHSNGKDYGV